MRKKGQKISWHCLFKSFFYICLQHFLLNCFVVYSNLSFFMLKQPGWSGEPPLPVHNDSGPTSAFHPGLKPQKRINTEGRQRSSLLVGGRTWMQHLLFSSKDDLKISFWENIPFWREWSAIFSKHLFCQVAVILFILFFQSLWNKITGAAMNWINSVPKQYIATTFVISSVFILLLYMQKNKRESSLHQISSLI